jgi:AcrR family transcriptional regulator
VARKYVQRARAEAAAETRRRIVEAARSVLLASALPTLEIADVAEIARVARSTIYTAFGSRPGLIEAVMEDSLTRAGFGRLVELFGLEDAVEALDRGLAQGCQMYAEEHQVLRRLLLLAELDPDGAAPYARQQRGRSAGMRDLARRLDEQGKLRAGTSVEEAAAVLWVMTGFDTFDQLYSGWGLDATSCSSRIVAMARAALLK